MQIFRYIKLFFVVQVAVFLLSPADMVGQNKNIENKKAEVSKLQDDIKFIDSQLQKTKKERTNSLNQLRLIRKKVQTRQSIIKKLEANIQEQDKQIEDKAAELIEMQSHLDTLTQRYKQLIYKAYANRDSKLWYMHILSSKNVEQGYRRLGYIKNFTNRINEQAIKIKEHKEKIEKEKEELTELKNDNIKSQKEKTHEWEKLKKEENDSQKYVASLQKKQNQFAKELKKKQQQAARLNKEIEKMIRAAIAADKKGGDKKNKTATKDEYIPTPEITKLSSQFSTNKGKLPWPVKKGVIIEHFGVNSHPTIKGVKLPHNNGINISAPEGCNVTAVFDGIVKQILFIPGYSNCILVAHGEYFTFYCKIGDVKVKAGQSVKTGDVIGTLDSSSELHFEIWRGTQKQNPEWWLKSI